MSTGTSRPAFVVSRAPLRFRLQDRETHVPGEPGLWVLLFGDLSAFTLLFGVLVYEQAEHSGLFATSQATLNTWIGLVNTLILLTTSLFVAAGVRGLRRGRPVQWPFVAALLGGAAFSGLKVVEYAQKLSEGVGLTENEFWLYYFMLTGIHWLHLLVGMGGLAYLWRMSRRPVLDPAHVKWVEGTGCYWHLVDLLWLVIFPLLYLFS